MTDQDATQPTSDNNDNEVVRIIINFNLYKFQVKMKFLTKSGSRFWQEKEE